MTRVYCAIILSTAPDQVRLPLAMLLVFGSAKLLDEIFERLRMPGIVGQIVAGVVLGPGVLGWLSPDDFFPALTELGLMFLLFQVGLEIKSSDLMKSGPTATLVAVLGMAVPFFAGWGLLSAWGEPRLEAIFVGAAMVATSVGITAQVLAAKGLLQERASRIILGAAVIDDVLGLLILALVSSMAKGKVNLLELGLTAGLALAFIVIVVKWGTKTAGKVIPHLHQKMRAGEAQFAAAMVLMFALSVLAVYAGVAAIIGAFLAGMALSETVDRRVHDLSQGVTELLVPFFLVGIGLRFNVGSFAVWSMVEFSVLVFAVAVVSKFVGCGIGAYRLGRTDATRVGVGMIPRGEVGMVVAQIGLSLGVITGRIYDAVVFMAIMTTLAAPLLLKLAHVKPGKSDRAREEMPVT